MIITFRTTLVILCTLLFSMMFSTLAQTAVLSERSEETLVPQDQQQQKKTKYKIKATLPVECKEKYKNIPNDGFGFFSNNVAPSYIQ